MKPLILTSAAMAMFATAFSSLPAAEGQGPGQPVSPAGPVGRAVQIAESQVSSQPIPRTGPVSRVLEINRQKNVFILRTVFGR